MQESSPPESSRPVTTLRLGERTVVRCDDGLLAAEYALFDGSSIVLQTTEIANVREGGYMTTAHDALGRLSRAGVTPAFAETAARALSRDVATTFARGAPARSVMSHLGAQELFDGAIFRTGTSQYEGAWLDLAALSAQLPIPGASVFLQILHLAAALAEVPGATAIYMSTADATRERRPGERTHSRVDLGGVFGLPDALARLRPRAPVAHADPSRDRTMRRALVARVRERLAPDTPEPLRAHLGALDSALAPRTMDVGALTDPALQSIVHKLAAGDPHGVDEQLDELESHRGAGAGTRYLRARAAHLRGAPAAGEIRLAEIVDSPNAPRRVTDRPRGVPIVSRYDPEIAESLALPAGATESTLDPQQFPRTALQARVAMVRCARELGRDYRLWYGKTLRCDVLAVDAMQQHLMRSCTGRSWSDDTVAWELRRHGALLSEIVARALGGAWTDVGPSEPGYWTMLVPPGTHTWPIGRVHRFVALGSRGKDLVGYYLDLEARVRAGG